LAATGTDLIEIQANQFAAELLLPSFLLDTLLSKEFDIDDEGPLDALAKKFKVSKQMLEYRIRSFR
jgi:Zn-dependent peptidase ImmA (M78 family)